MAYVVKGCKKKRFFKNAENEVLLVGVKNDDFHPILPTKTAKNPRFLRFLACFCGAFALFFVLSGVS